MNVARLVQSTRVVQSIICTAVLFTFVGNTQAKTSNVFFQYSSLNPAGHVVVTSDPDLPLLQYIDHQYGISDIAETSSLPEGVLALYKKPNGEVITISSSSGSAVSTSQDGIFPLSANTCEDVFGSGFPHEISGSDLPYSQAFDTTQATDSGDHRGTAADNISRPGGHDGFWSFTPDESGTYILSNSATKGTSVPFPDHDFDRGFGGIGIWTGNCGETLVEVGTANSILGDSILPVKLEAGTTYIVIWEDFFVGSVENSVTISIEFAGSPIGNTISDAIDLSDRGWNFSVVGDTTVNQDIEDGPCVEPPVDGEGHGPGSGTTGADIWYQLPSVTPGETYTLNVLSDDTTDFVDSAITLHAYNFTTHQVSQLDCQNDISEDNRLSSISFVAGPTFIYYAMIESVPAFDQPSFGTFVFEGSTQTTSSVKFWEEY